MVSALERVRECAQWIMDAKNGCEWIMDADLALLVSFQVDAPIIFV